MRITFKRNTESSINLKKQQQQLKSRNGYKSRNIISNYGFDCIENLKQKDGNGAEVKKQKATGLSVGLCSQRVSKNTVSKLVQMLYYIKI